MAEIQALKNKITCKACVVCNELHIRYLYVLPFFAKYILLRKYFVWGTSTFMLMLTSIVI